MKNFRGRFRICSSCLSGPTNEANQRARAPTQGPLSLFPTAAVCFYGSARLIPGTRRENDSRIERQGNDEGRGRGGQGEGRKKPPREEGRIPRGAPRTTCRVRLDKTAKLPWGDNGGGNHTLGKSEFFFIKR